MSRWVKVEDSLPRVGEEVFAAFKGQFSWVMFRAQMTLHMGLFAPGYAAPTHWRTLPEPPNESD